jgi:predicted nucleotide-binding protein
LITVKARNVVSVTFADEWRGEEAVVRKKNLMNHPRSILNERPRLCIVASPNSVGLARLAQRELNDDFEPRIWSIETLGSEDILMEDRPPFDYALILLHEDDAKGRNRPCPRNELLCILGFFIARLGSDRTFVLHDKGISPILPKTLRGYIPLDYREPMDGDLQGAIGSACTDIRITLHRHRTESDEESAARAGSRPLDEEVVRRLIAEEVKRQITEYLHVAQSLRIPG